MEILISYSTTVTCSIELLEREMFIYRRSWWVPPRIVSSLNVAHDHFRMYYRDKNRTLRTISRDNNPENIHFVSTDQVPDMPARLRSAVEENLAMLHEQDRIANPTIDVPFFP
ncbi:MAG: hypothetical protein JWO54_605 [Candidatus Saccharibacteria bacterium]|nr:hypothetical protein [Candidatus Saccharibacteria bacterium]MDB5180845.1 hypothetical protein [Candidatus Saccharibacteria bacterium]